jgi:hypothetical protein
MDAIVVTPRGRYTIGLHRVDSDGDDLRVVRDAELVDVVFGPTARKVFVSTYPPGKRDGEIYELDLQGNAWRRVTPQPSGRRATDVFARRLQAVVRCHHAGDARRAAGAGEGPRSEHRSRHAVASPGVRATRPDFRIRLGLVARRDEGRGAGRRARLDQPDRVTSVETRAFGEAVQERPKMRLFGWLP